MGFTTKKRREGSRTDRRLRWDVYNGGTGASGKHSETLVQNHRKEQRMKERRKEGKKEGGMEGRKERQTKAEVDGTLAYLTGCSSTGHLEVMLQLRMRRAWVECCG